MKHYNWVQYFSQGVLKLYFITGRGRCKSSKIIFYNILQHLSAPTMPPQAANLADQEGPLPPFSQQFLTKTYRS